MLVGAFCAQRPDVALQGGMQPGKSPRRPPAVLCLSRDPHDRRQDTFTCIKLCSSRGSVSIHGSRGMNTASGAASVPLWSHFIGLKVPLAWEALQQHLGCSAHESSGDAGPHALQDACMRRETLASGQALVSMPNAAGWSRPQQLTAKGWYSTPAAESVA